MDREEILGMGINALRTKLSELGLSTQGMKDELQQRLLTKYDLDSSDHDESREELGENVEGGAHADGPPGVNRHAVFHENPVEKSMYTLRDVEDSLSHFSGTSAPDVIQWLDEFEEMAIILRWSALQKFVYGRQLLVGAAKLFIKSQRGIRDWDSLRSALKDEFDVRCSTAEVIRQIRGRSLSRNETLTEYLYCIMELASKIDLDEISIMEYFIEGIPDSRANKTVLYQANNIKELKMQLKVYEKTRLHPRPASKGKDPVSSDRKNDVVKGQKQEVHQRCFKCGNRSHIAKECTKQYKCFKCQEFGHRSFECPDNKSLERFDKNKGREANMVQIGAGLIFKDVIMRGKEFSALIDTGCDTCLIRYDLLFVLGEIDFVAEKIRLHGIGDSVITTLGRFDEVVHVDEVSFEVTFYVVGERDVNHSIILGNSLLRKAEVTIINGEVTLKKAVEKNPLLEEFAQLCLSTTESEPDVPVDLEHLSDTIKSQVMKVIIEYQPQRNVESPVKMNIVLKDDTPVCERPRRLPLSDQAIVEKQVAEWLKEKIVQPSSSEYAAPVVLASKKDGTKRLCCDYRKLNQKIVRDQFPMPLIDEVLDKLQGAKFYTTLDLRNGFFHVPLEPASRKYTAFVTHRGQYEFLYVPFGISNSPAVFTRFISAVFKDCIRDGVVIAYMDDLIIPAKDMSDGFQKFEMVANIAAMNGLRIKWEKCQILQETVEFLGYIVRNGSIKPAEGKIEAVKNFPVPTDRKLVQRFLGLTSYFRRFVEDYAIMAKPLTDLLRKDTPFKVTDEVLLAVKQLKEALVSAPVLKLYDPDAPTEVHADASKVGYGAILLQKSVDDLQCHPVQYMSRRTKPYEENYHSYELEVLAIVEALKKWRVYLLGIPFKIVTDCNAFRMTMRKNDVPARIARWAMFLQEFSYEIEHRPGTKMKHVDALSRMRCLIAEGSLTHRLRCAQESDECTKAIRAVLERGGYEDYFLKNGILHKDLQKELIVVPAQLEEEIIKLAHNQGHYGVVKTRELIERQYYISGLASKVPRVVKSCIECIITDSKAGKKEGFLSPIYKEDRPLITYHLDHVGPMEITKKAYNHLFVVVDGFSKFVWLYPTKSTDSKSVIDCLEKQASIFGNPRRFITDRGTAFTSNLFSEYCRSENIQHLVIATGVPRGNGQVERIHRIVVPLLAKLCIQDPSLWYRHVRRVQMFINSTPSRSTRYSPFKLMTGVDMRLSEYPDLRELLDDEVVQEFETERDEVRDDAKESIARIQNENRETFNRNRKKATEYAIDELVAIKRTQFGTGMKLRGKFLGPYKVIKKMPHGRYEVEKVGSHDGPNRTTTVAENMKKWQSGPNCCQEGRM